jgi:hypothetical protein
MLESRAARVIAALVAMALVVALFIVLGDDGDDGDERAAKPAATAPAKDPAEPAKKDERPAPDPAPQVPVVVVENGEPAGGVAELTFEKGEAIRFIVRSDSADEVHLHGYDVSEGVEAGGKAEFDVPAEIEGVFDVELEVTHTPIAEITVEP